MQTSVVYGNREQMSGCLVGDIGEGWKEGITEEHKETFGAMEMCVALITVMVVYIDVYIHQDTLNICSLLYVN